MRTFDYKSEYQKLLTPEIVSLISQIHELKGQQNLFIEAKKNVLAELLEIAKIQSTEASNRMHWTDSITECTNVTLCFSIYH